VTWVIWNLVSLRLETMLVSVQDRCTVCAERTIGSVLGDMAQLEARIGPFGDSANLDAR
jgi:hypothetical protein